ncbi:MAG: PcfJ domain-containing protein, partial [Clostridiales bacterium]
KDSIHKDFITINFDKNLTQTHCRDFFDGIYSFEILKLINDLDKICETKLIKPNFGNMLKSIRVLEKENFHYLLYISFKYYPFEAFVKSGFSHLIKNPYEFVNNINKLPNPKSNQISKITGMPTKILNYLSKSIKTFDELINSSTYIEKFGYNNFVIFINNKSLNFSHLQKVSRLLDFNYKSKELFKFIDELAKINICTKSSNDVYCIGKICNFSCEKKYQNKKTIDYWLNLIDNCLVLSKKSNLKINKYNKYILNDYNLLKQINNTYLENVDDTNLKLKNYYNKISYKLIQFDNKYKLICPKSIRDFKVEEYNMKHCISSYIENVIKNQTTILFLKKDNGNCYMTLELNKKNELIQAKKKLNILPDKDDLKYLKKLAIINNWTLKLK